MGRKLSHATAADLQQHPVRLVRVVVQRGQTWDEEHRFNVATPAGRKALRRWVEQIAPAKAGEDE